MEEAAASYDVCWTYLCDIKTSNISEDPRPLVDFQPRLAAAIAALSRLYAQIARERRELVRSKASLSANWFTARQRLLDARQRALNYAINTGRCLGDSFAYFFYRNDSYLLQNHLSQPAVPHAPTGIGGIGELEFVKNVKTVHGKMMLYHGITSILRIGDVSLIDLKTHRVAGLAELKSWSPEKGRVEVNLIAVGPGLKRSSTGTEVPLGDALKPKITLSAGAKDRLARQLKKIGETFKKDKNPEGDTKLRIESRNHMRALDRLVRNARRRKFSFVKVDNGLVLGAIRSPFRSLLANATQELNAGNALNSEDLISHLTNLMDKTRVDNSLSIGMLVYDDNGRLSHLTGMAQLFWWDLSLRTLHALIFHEVIVVTIFNHAHILKSFERMGFKVELQPKGGYRITKKIGGHVMELGEASYFFQMIQRHLFTESFILEAIGDLEKRAEEKSVEGRYDAVHMDLRFNQEIAVRLRRTKANLK